MKRGTSEQRMQDQTFIAAGGLVVAGLLMLGIPPWILFGM